MTAAAPAARDSRDLPAPSTVAGLGAPRSVEPRTVADAMIAVPKTLGVEISLADARHALSDTHVHMLLLTRDGILHGTLVREDLRHDLDPRRPAVTLATLAERTVSPDRPLGEATRIMEESMARRLAVTDSAGRLLGLLCLNRTRQRYCTEADVVARVSDQQLEWPRTCP